jgi:hypothetical protein
MNLEPAVMPKMVCEVYVGDLAAGMIVDQDVIAHNGLLLLARGQEVTPPMIARLESFRDTHGVVEPFRVHALPAAPQETPVALGG